MDLIHFRNFMMTYVDLSMLYVYIPGQKFNTIKTSVLHNTTKI